MKIIVNAATNNIGGGLQVAISFISECIKFTRHTYYVFINNEIEKQLNLNSYTENFHFYKIPKLKFYQYNSYLSDIEKSIKADIVFSIFGPTYWRPKVPHIMGFAMGHYIYPDSPYWNMISLKDKFIWFLKKKIHLFYFKRDADEFICETKDAAVRLQKIINKKCHVVSNTCSDFFYKFQIKKETDFTFLSQKDNNEYRFLAVCTPYLHKNLHIIPKVLDELKKNDTIKPVFILTINKDEFTKIIPKKYRNNVVPIGRIDISKLPYLYSECDFVFIPSLLECFTANFPEAMIMKKPILAANLDYAKSICDNAAVYFDPLSSKDISAKIIELIKNKKRQTQLIENGLKKLSSFNNASERANLYINILETKIKCHDYI